jgi:uncharacterized protein (TIGR03435 family)
MPRYLLAIALCATAPAQEAFDVASFKPLQVEPSYEERIVAHPGTLRMSNVRLRTCIEWAYSVHSYQLIGPAWLGDANDYWYPPRFEIVAKAAPSTPVASLRLMLRTLLVERLKLAVHRETRNLAAWVIMLPETAHELRLAPDPDGEFHFTPTTTGLKVENATVDDFANLISGPLQVAVVDRTGLSGRFNFSLDFSTYPVPSDREYLFSRALREQLGLKVERQKLAIEILVVDKAERVPTEN